MPYLYERLPSALPTTTRLSRGGVPPSPARGGRFARRVTSWPKSPQYGRNPSLQCQSADFCGGCDMKRIFAAAAITLAFAPSGVLAQERTGDAALGALSGAVVLGPVGAVAGAVIGYTAGPSIAQSWGLRRSSESRRRGPSARASGNAASSQGPSTQGVATAGPSREGSEPPSKPSAQSARAQDDAIPPVQTLE